MTAVAQSPNSTTTVSSLLPCSKCYKQVHPNTTVANFPVTNRQRVSDLLRGSYRQLPLSNMANELAPIHCKIPVYPRILCGELSTFKHRNVDPRFRYFVDTQTYTEPGSVKMRKTRHKVSVDIRISFAV